MNEISNKLEFISNKNISEKKSKPIPATSEKRTQGKEKGLSVHDAGLSCLWDTGASYCMINKNYVKKFQE